MASIAYIPAVCGCQGCSSVLAQSWVNQYVYDCSAGTVMIACWYCLPGAAADGNVLLQVGDKIDYIKVLSGADKLVNV